MSYRHDDTPRLISEITDLEERAARAVCANQGACQNDDCKVGKGLAPSPDNCVASREQLFTAGHVKVARAVMGVFEGWVWNDNESN